MSSINQHPADENVLPAINSNTHNADVVMQIKEDAKFAVNSRVNPGRNQKRALGDITNDSAANRQGIGSPGKHKGVYQRKAPSQRTRSTTSALANASSAATTVAPTQKQVEYALPPGVIPDHPDYYDDDIAVPVIKDVSIDVHANDRACDSWMAVGDTRAVQAASALPSSIIDIDGADTTLCLSESVWAPAVHSNMKKRETSYMVNADYMDLQTDITEKMREILVDWLVDVHKTYSLRPETLFLSVNVLDRYMSNKHISRRRLQLVGMTALSIACKYEETQTPTFLDFVHISDNAYTVEDILEAELDILTSINFDICVPLPLQFLRRLMKACAATTGDFHTNHDYFARYTLELSLQNLGMLKYRPSLLAAAACNLTAKLVRDDFTWCITMWYHSGGWTEDDLVDCERSIYALLKQQVDPDGVNKLTAVKRKFSSSRYSQVSYLAATVVEDVEVEIDGDAMDVSRSTTL